MDRSNQIVTRRRILFLSLAVIVVFAGLASRKYREQLPEILAQYAGDTLWALMLYLLISVLLAGRTIVNRAAFSMILAFLVELSQLYHAPWIDSIRQTPLGGLVLGFGFLWSDLVCYTAGITIGAAAEWGIQWLGGASADKGPL